MSEISIVGAAAPFVWYKNAWKLFTPHLTQWVLMALIFFVLVLLLGFTPLLGLGAIYLLIPLLQGGMLQAARKVDQGVVIDFTDLFAAFRDEKFRTPLFILGLLMLGVVFAVAVISAPFLGGDLLPAMEAAAPSAPSPTATMPSVSMMGMLFGLTIALMIGMMFMFAPALVMLSGMPPLQAIKTSFMPCWRNFLPYVIFMLVYGLLSIVSMFTFGLGLLVLLPVVTCAVYLAYKDILA